MNGKSSGMVDETTLAKVISGQFEYPQQNVGSPFPFVATYSDLPKELTMKKLLISSVVVALCAGVPVVYADDAHHPEQGSASASKPVAGKNVLPKQPAAPDKAMSSGVADAQMVKAQERMKQAQALMAKLRETQDPAERQKLMREHTQAMRDTMGMMRGMKMGMEGCQGMGMMMGMHQMMDEHMGMMQMMMEQMIDRQDMLMPGGK